MTDPGDVITQVFDNGRDPHAVLDELEAMAEAAEIAGDTALLARIREAGHAVRLYAAA
jgi:hypothetical protein